MKKQLHSVLAAEGDLNTAAHAILMETKGLFRNSQASFDGYAERVEFYNEADVTANDTGELAQHMPAFQKSAGAHDTGNEMVTTVPERLRYTLDAFKPLFDCVATKDVTNCVASAAIVVNGAELTRPLPAPTLLWLEKQLKQVKDVMLSAPTMDPAVRWVPDEARGGGVYRREKAERTVRTRKIPTGTIVAPATKEHKAQVTPYTLDVPIGEKVMESWTGRLTSALKNQLIRQCDTLIAAVKDARQIANQQETVVVDDVGALTDFLLSPLGV